ncbi:MAG: hypothetical protein PHU25_08375 [Deltaproteobacteria bacterium]|nr:hypothetical protein [Deltaproteobacteria bacterium]
MPVSKTRILKVERATALLSWAGCMELWVRLSGERVELYGWEDIVCLLFAVIGIPLMYAFDFFNRVGAVKRLVQFFYFMAMVGFDLLLVARSEQIFNSRAAAILSMLVVTAVLSWRIHANRGRRGIDEEEKSQSIAQEKPDPDLFRPPGKGPIHLEVVPEHEFLSVDRDRKIAKWLSSDLASHLSRAGYVIGAAPADAGILVDSFVLRIRFRRDVGEGEIGVSCALCAASKEHPIATWSADSNAASFKADARKKHEELRLLINRKVRELRGESIGAKSIGSKLPDPPSQPNGSTRID